MNDCAKYQELISCLIDGELTEHQAAELEQHMAHCPECMAMYRDFSAVSGCVSSGMEKVPAGLHDSIMSGVKAAAKAKKAKKPVIVRLRPYMAAAACLVVIVGAVFALRDGVSFETASNSSSSTTATAAADCNVSDKVTADSAPAQSEEYGFAYSTTESSSEPECEAGEDITDDSPAADSGENNFDTANSSAAGTRSMGAECTGLLTEAWYAFPEDGRFAISGGDYGNSVMDAPGACDLNDLDGLNSLFGIPASAAGYMDGAASMMHMMNSNIFTAFCAHLLDVSQTEYVMEEILSSLSQREFVCGVPEKMAIIQVEGEYIVSVYGYAQNVDNLVSALESLYDCVVFVHKSFA